TKFIDAQRAQRRSARVLKQLTSPEASSCNPLDRVVADDEAQRLYRALYSLDVPERTVLVLHYLQGLSYREMALVLDEPTGTVKWRTGEALHRLRALLWDEELDHAPRTTWKPGPIS